MLHPMIGNRKIGCLIGCLTVLAFRAAADVVPASAELPPFLPAVKKLKMAEVVRPEEVAVGELIPTRFRQVRSLNGEWRISGVDTFKEPVPAATAGELKIAAPDFDDSRFDVIAVPGNFFLKYKVQSKAKPYAKAWYRKEFMLTPEELAGKRLILKFERVAYETEIFLNGTKIGDHHGQYNAFEIDATAAAKAGRNVLAMRVLVDNGPQYGTGKAYHTYGSAWWAGLIPGGITGNVELSLEPEIRLGRVLIAADSDGKLRAEYTVFNHSDSPRKVELQSTVTSAMKAEANRVFFTGTENVTLAPGENRGVLECRVSGFIPWDINHPQLYFLTLAAKEKDRVVEAKPFRFGFRDFRIVNNRFELNGTPLYLFSANLSSHYFENEFDPKKLDELALRWLLGFRNRGYVILRTSHMPVRERVAELADQCGVMLAPEWGWAFTKQIDHEKFPRHNQPELEEFALNFHNYPSVVLWSLGNEVSHIADPWIAEQFDEQVRLVRRVDRQKRPVSAFSGSAAFGSYGRARLDTDLLDNHTYNGLSTPWVRFAGELDYTFRELQKIYAPGRKTLPMPMVGWEHIGFSWGIKPDPKFRPGDVDAYLAYARRIDEATWGNPLGIGFSGSIGLAAALDSERGEPYAQRIYMHRIFETILLDGRMAGYAPWDPKPELDSIALMSQPVYPALTDDAGLFPRSLFAGERSKWTAAVVNVSARDLSNLTLRLTLADRAGNESPVADFPVPQVESFQTFREPVELKLPEKAAGFRQLRLRLLDAAGNEIARNYYDLFLADPSIRTAGIDAARPVFVYDTGHKGNVGRTLDILKRHGIEAGVCKDVASLRGNELLIVPAEVTPAPPIDLAGDAKMMKFLESGGVVLLLEQQNLSSKLPGGLGLITAPACFADLVSPDHPVFRGLDQRNFDTWLNREQKGQLIRVAYPSVSGNTLAAKGVMLGSRDLYSVVVEAKVGKGRLIASQLNAAALCDTDSSAATWLVNLLRYAAGNALWEKARPLEVTAGQQYSVIADRVRAIDLAPHANRSFSDEKDGDRAGGWTDQGTNDFRGMPSGNISAAGVPFRIIDPAANGGKSCIVLHGTNRPYFPESVCGIKVGGHVSRLFFLHTSAWGNQLLCGAYRMHYADGSTSDCLLQGGRNIADWWFPWFLPEAKIGLRQPREGENHVGLFVAEWVNPHPEKEVVSFDFLSAKAYRANATDYLPGNESVPVLVAVSAERGSDAPVRITDAQSRAGVIGGYHLPDKGTLERKGEEVLYRFPRYESRKDSPAPGFILFFDRAKMKGDYHTLGFEARSSKPVSVSVVIPSRDWQLCRRAVIDLPGGNVWHPCRLRFGEDLKGNFPPGTPWRGEILIQSRRGDSENVKIGIRNMVLQ